MAHEHEEASTRRRLPIGSAHDAPEFLDPEHEVDTSGRRVPGYGLAPYQQRSAVTGQTPISTSVPSLPSLGKTTVAVPRRRSPQATPTSFDAGPTDPEVSQYSRSFSMTTPFGPRPEPASRPSISATPSKSASTSKVLPFERQMIVPSIYPEPKVISKSVKEREAAAPEKKSSTEKSSKSKSKSESKSKSKSEPTSESKSKSAHSNVTPLPPAPPAPTPAPEPAPRASGSQPGVPIPQAAEAPRPSQPPEPEPRPSEMQLPPGMAMFDPLMVPVPPELAPTVYGWIRRLALQNDLATADRILRDALLELSNSLSITVVYPGADGLWSLGPDEEVPKDPGPTIACAQARKALVSSHTAIIPIITTTETVAVVVLTRNPRNPAFHPLEALAALGFVRESAAIMHHLSTAHLTRQAERAADKGSLYRGEALEAHRNRTTEGPPISLSPGWVKRTYPFLLAALFIALLFTAFIKVPTYASGQGVIIIDGDAVSVSVQGTVSEVVAQPQTSVKKGAIILRLDAQPELDDLAAAQRRYNEFATTFLFDQTDENNKKQMGEMYAQLELAKKKVEQKVIRAPRDGILSDIRPTKGTLVSPGDPVASIMQPDAEVQVIAFVPDADLPRLRHDQKIQVDFPGFTKVSEKAPITEIRKEAIGSNEVGKIVGASFALKLPEGGRWAVVRGRMNKQFMATHQKFFLHTGMTVKTDIMTGEKPFLAQLLPALEKYVPD